MRDAVRERTVASLLARAEELPAVAPADDRRAWAEPRRRRAGRRRARARRSRFRRDPAAYLADLEQQLSQLPLPA